jgi:hypothetical protein
VTRQRFHELRNSKRFPPPLAELGNGPVWSGSAVRGFLARWVEAAWPAPGRNRSLRRRRRHHPSPHRDRRRAHRHCLGARPARCDRTRARVDSPARPDLLTPGRDQWPRHLPGATLGMGAAHHRRRNTQSRSHPLTPTLPTVRHAHAGPRLFRIGVLGLCGRKLALSRERRVVSGAGHRRGDRRPGPGTTGTSRQSATDSRTRRLLLSRIGGVLVVEVGEVGSDTATVVRFALGGEVLPAGDAVTAAG